MKHIFACTLALATCFTAHTALAQGYPSKPIRMVAPFAAGGAVDLMARYLCERLSVTLGKPCVVENRTGAGGIIGFDFVAKAEPDGHTLLLGPNTMGILPTLHAKLPYDTEKDFAPIALVSSTPAMIGAHPSVPANTIQELIAHVKANPGKVAFTSCAPTSVQHLGGEQMAILLGLKWAHIPYKGCGPALADVVAGHVPVFISTVAHFLPQIKAGKLRGYAVLTAERSPFAPEYPTIAETVLPGFRIDLWFAVFAPAKTPAPIIETLNAETNKALKDSDMRQKLLSQSYDPLGGTPAQLGEALRVEVVKYAKIIREAGIKLE